MIDLEQTPPRVIDHIVVGDAPEGFAISPKGDLALAILLRGSNSDKTNLSWTLARGRFPLTAASLSN